MLSSQVKKVHCLGVGGIGVSALAEILHCQGFVVSGSDSKESQVTQRLASEGVQIFLGHDQDHVEGVDLVIYSSAISLDHPVLQRARQLDVPCMMRGEVLALLFNQQRGVAVVGSHGKSTATGFVAQLLVEAGLDPTTVIGGVIQGGQGPVRFGQGDLWVIEGDESDGSFLLLRPTVAVVTNIDRDHLSHYGGDYQRLLDAFVEFLNRLPEDGVAILNLDDPGVQAILPSLKCQVVGFGEAPSVDVRLLAWQQCGMQSSFHINMAGKALEAVIQLPGYHNILNAMAACAVAHYFAVDPSVLERSLSRFRGVGRRLQQHAEISVSGGRALVLEDYGHHPHAVEVTLRAVQKAWPDRRLVLVFQPHRYSRTSELIAEFARVLAMADCLVLLEVYSAGECFDEGAAITSLLAAVNQRRSGDTFYVECLSELPRFLSSIVQANDILLFQGAGDVGSFAARLAKTEELEKL